MKTRKSLLALMTTLFSQPHSADNTFRPNHTYFPPNKRNGAKECARRLAQGK